MPVEAPPIYAPTIGPLKLTFWARLTAAIICGACLVILLTAAKLPPSASGTGTHESLGLAQCQFLARTGLPCPSCGMTTSFSHLVRGHLWASIYVQPMGFVIGLLVVATFWVALYTAISAKPAHRLMLLVPARYYLLPLMFFAVAGWGWKIFIHLRGIDGW
jgi:Protein of unknown function (DUF2752)